MAAAAGADFEEVSCGEEGIEAVLGGGGTCVAAGTEYVVAESGERLRLETLTARLVDLKTSKRISGDYLDPRESKNGVYAIGTLSIGNESDRAEVFDDFGEQVQLKVGGSTYGEPFNVLNGVATDSFLWKAKKIKPGDSQVGKVVFDVPESAAEELPETGVILVLNFPDQGNPRRADQVGLLRAG